MPAVDKKPKDSNSHPPYFQMIKEAILALKERNGSSPYAIAKHIEEKHKGILPSNYKKILGVQLKNFVAKGKLVKVKASFKLSVSGKKEEGRQTANKEKKRESEEKKEAVVEKKSANEERKKKNGNKSKNSKKAMPPLPNKAKQPQSIKPPAKKKMRN